MSLVKFDPFRNFSSLTRRMNDMMDDFNSESFLRSGSDFYPTVDIHEDENSIHLEAEIPGVNKKDIKVSVNDDNMLIIKGTKKRESKTEEKDSTYLRVERSFGEFTRSFMLPDNVDKDSINAEFKDGLLKVDLTKKEPEKPKEKEVKVK